MEKDKDMKIAMFRFGIISEFVTGVKLNYGQKEHLLKVKTDRTYDVPYSKGRTLSKSTILKWISEYKNAGFRLEGLFPKTRKDKGTYKTLDASIRLAIKELKRENPKLTVPAIIKKLKHKKIINMEAEINPSCVYVFLKKEKLNKLNEDAVDKRHFEASHTNEIWQSDVMHGPRVKIDDINRKTYLVAIIDDHSRFIVHAEFYPHERIENIKDCLKKAVEKRGIPQKFYIDNGSCYRSVNLDQIAALLGISIKHSRPYQPEGRGKIERWFRTVRDCFILSCEGIGTINELNEAFESWLEEYNNNVHGTTKETPYNRFKKGLECVRPAPKDLIDYFRCITFRRVKRDRTFKLKGVLYEAPVCLIDRKIELRYHQEEANEIEIFFNGHSFGNANLLDPHVNSKIGRNWKSSTKEPSLAAEILEKNNFKSGELFKGVENERL